MKSKLLYGISGLVFLGLMTWTGLHGYTMWSLVYDFFAGIMAALLIFEKEA